MIRNVLPFLIVVSVGFAKDPEEIARLVLQDTGFVEAKLNLPWRHWQDLSDEQKSIFEKQCQYNQELLEAELIDYLVLTFTENELAQIHKFHSSETGRKWVSATGLRGEFDFPPLHTAAARWFDGRYGEARSYVASLITETDWQPPGYKGKVGSHTAPPGSYYKGETELDVFGKGEAHFNKIFGTPEERSERMVEDKHLVRLKTFWKAYLVESTFMDDELQNVTIIRLPNENDSYADKMRTQLLPTEIENMKTGVSEGRSWIAWAEKSQSSGSTVSYLEGGGLFCMHKDYLIMFDTVSSFGRSPGP